MAEMYLMVFGPMLAGIVLALVWWAVWGRKTSLVVGSIRLITVIAGLIPLVGEAVVRLLSIAFLLPFGALRGYWYWYDDYRFLLPLMFGILGTILLPFPIRARRGTGTAELIRRTPASFIRATWFVVPGIVLGLILAISVFTGMASQLDPETGQYTMYWVKPGAQFGIGTTIFGWFYSVPGLILIGVMIAVAMVSIVLIARPALAGDRERDTRERTIRTRNIFVAVTGALLLHLGIIFRSLFATSSMRGTFPTPDGSVTFTPPFSAFGPAFFGASIFCAVLGIACWAIVVLSAVPWRRYKQNAAQS